MEVGSAAPDTVNDLFNWSDWQLLTALIVQCAPSRVRNTWSHLKVGELINKTHFAAQLYDRALLRRPPRKTMAQHGGPLKAILNTPQLLELMKQVLLLRSQSPAETAGTRYIEARRVVDAFTTAFRNEAQESGGLSRPEPEHMEMEANYPPEPGSGQASSNPRRDVSRSDSGLKDNQMLPILAPAGAMEVTSDQCAEGEEVGGAPPGKEPLQFSASSDCASSGVGSSGVSELSYSQRVPSHTTSAAEGGRRSYHFDPFLAKGNAPAGQMLEDTCPVHLTKADVWAELLPGDDSWRGDEAATLIFHHHFLEWFLLAEGLSKEELFRVAGVDPRNMPSNHTEEVDGARSNGCRKGLCEPQVLRDKHYILLAQLIIQCAPKNLRRTHHDVAKVMDKGTAAAEQWYRRWEAHTGENFIDDFEGPYATILCDNVMYRCMAEALAGKAPPVFYEFFPIFAKVVQQPPPPEGPPEYPASSSGANPWEDGSSGNASDYSPMVPSPAPATAAADGAALLAAGHGPQHMQPSAVGGRDFEQVRECGVQSRLEHGHAVADCHPECGNGQASGDHVSSMEVFSSVSELSYSQRVPSHTTSAAESGAACDGSGLQPLPEQKSASGIDLLLVASRLPGNDIHCRTEREAGPRPRAQRPSERGRQVPPEVSAIYSGNSTKQRWTPEEERHVLLREKNGLPVEAHQNTDGTVRSEHAVRQWHSRQRKRGNASGDLDSEGEDKNDGSNKKFKTGAVPR